jgi:hypothetical protein
MPFIDDASRIIPHRDSQGRPLPARALPTPPPRTNEAREAPRIDPRIRDQPLPEDLRQRQQPQHHHARRTNPFARRGAAAAATQRAVVLNGDESDEELPLPPHRREEEAQGGGGERRIHRSGSFERMIEREGGPVGDDLQRDARGEMTEHHPYYRAHFPAPRTCVFPFPRFPSFPFSSHCCRR